MVCVTTPPLPRGGSHAAGWFEHVEVQGDGRLGDAGAAAANPGSDVGDRVLVQDVAEPDWLGAGEAADQRRTDDDDIGPFADVQAVAGADEGGDAGKLA